MTKHQHGPFPPSLYVHADVIVTDDVPEVIVGWRWTVRWRGFGVPECCCTLHAHHRTRRLFRRSIPPCRLCHPHRPPIQRSKEIHLNMSQITVHDDQPRFTAHLLLEDSAGQPTIPDDTPEWTSSADNVATVSSTTTDGMSATIAIPGGIGVAQITATTTDRDGTKIVLTGEIEVVAGEAVRGDITFDLSGGSAPVAAPVDTPAAPTDVVVPDPTATTESGTATV